MVFVRLPPILASMKFAGEIPVNLGALISAYHQLSSFLRSGSLIAFAMYSAGTFLALTLPAWILRYYRKRKNSNKPHVCDADTPSPEGIVDDAYSGGMMNGIVAYEDAHSFFTLDSVNRPSSSVQGPTVSTELMKFEKAEGSSLSFCGICLENKESWQMFGNDTCDHSFCYDCTTSHIKTKIQDKVKDIACPAPNCSVVLNFDVCRLIIPDDALVEWDELLCMSLIPESQKLYCPFRDCSALLVNDIVDKVENVKCLVCSRSFCVNCRVPWHSDFTCEEFQKLIAKKGGKDKKIVKELAKKKCWQKCPKCKMYVEKSGGCVHIICRCRYQFCYRCGAKWSRTHEEICPPKPYMHMPSVMRIFC